MCAPRYLKEECGCTICGVEILPGAEPITSHPFRGNTAFMLGNEGDGLNEKQKAVCDHFVYIPHYGMSPPLCKPPLVPLVAADMCCLAAGRQATARRVSTSPWLAPLFFTTLACGRSTQSGLETRVPRQSSRLTRSRTQKPCLSQPSSWP